MPISQPQAHVSIDTSDLGASIAFYTALLGAEPSLVRHDYARFDVPVPPLLLGLNAVAHQPTASTGPLEHVGIRFDGGSELDAARARLKGLGLDLREEQQVECCYARLTRAWAVDPSGVHWELFVATEPVVEAPSRAGNQTTCCAPDCCATIAP